MKLDLNLVLNVLIALLAFKVIEKMFLTKVMDKVPTVI